MLQRLCKAIDHREPAAEIIKLNSEFYSLIPHKLGTKKEEVQKNAINSAAMLEEKQNLLQLMRDLVSLAERSGQQLAIKSEVDRRYLSLGCTITPLEPSSPQVRVYLRGACYTCDQFMRSGPVQGNPRSGHGVDAAAPA